METNNIKATLENLESDFLANLKEINQINDLIKLEITYLGRNGIINDLFKKLKKLNLKPSQSKVISQNINLFKQKIIKIIENKKFLLEQLLLENKIKNEDIDVTLPSLRLPKGCIHPLNQIINQIEDFFLGLGFSIYNDTELVNDLYNFEMLNIDKNHPARDMQDSFYFSRQNLLRTHTSSVQIKAMLNHKLKNQPLKIISSGKVYRRDKDDDTHSHQFTQLECFIVDRNINLINLKEIIVNFMQYLFGNKQKLRFRPSYFPFTKPSLEVDLVFENQKSNKVDYLEVLGAGLIHPQVLINGGFDPKERSGLAMGLGIERIAMLKYGIKDIRYFYNNDVRFLNQFVK
ncbi:MAG: phenylalanine--tRNA ligase subunit alpha [Vigna little leaf phytoplasma]|nr:phenylalanine--tRNA ligase subunit alpha [Vigna little leaf phytoplasma]